MNNNTLTWRNGLRRGGRRAWLLLTKPDGTAVWFRGTSLPGWCAVVRTEPGPTGGKWTSTVYELALASDVQPIELEPDVHGSWADQLGGTWEACADKLHLPVETVRRLFGGDIARTFNERAAALAALEA